MSQDFAAGASAARFKLRTYLKENGIDVDVSDSGCPPTDEDFLDGILSTFKEGSTRPSAGSALVLFHFWQCDYQVPIGASVLDYLTENSERRHDIFSLSTPFGPSTFFLALGESGQVTVYRKKHWRTASEEIDTTILRVR